MKHRLLAFAIVFTGALGPAAGNSPPASSAPPPPPLMLWEPLPALPVGLAGAAVHAAGESLEVGGGTTWIADTKQTLARRWRWQIGADAWKEGEAWSRPFAHGVAGVVDGRMLFAGGTDGRTTRDEVFTVESDGGLRLAGRLALPVAYAGGGVQDSTLFVLGGTTDLNDLSRLTAEFHAFDVATGRNERLPDYPGGAVMHARLVVLGERILVFPGGHYDAALRRATNDRVVWSYSIPERRWQKRAAFPFSVRGVAAASLGDKRHVLVAGGYRTRENGEGYMSRDAFLYDATTDQYHPLPLLPYAAMLMEMVRAGEWIYIIGGEDRARSRSPAAYRIRAADLLSAKA